MRRALVTASVEISYFLSFLGLSCVLGLLLAWFVGTYL